MKHVQLPHDARGEALCRHAQPGQCTWWCSYRRGVVCVGPVVALLVGAGVIRWVTGDDVVRGQVTQAFVGAAMFLVVVVPITVALNRADQP